MRSQEASQRYARALYNLSIERGNIDAVLNEIREFNKTLAADVEIDGFFNRPVVKSDDQKEALEKFFEKQKFSEEVRGLLMLLAQKRRFGLLPGITHAFQAVVDSSRSVARGDVFSATILFPEERQKLEATISRYTQQKAVLEYHEDKSLLGGLVAKVGSYTFDDSLETQLRLMKEALTKRRAN